MVHYKQEVLRLKKWMAFFLAFVLCVSAAGCGSMGGAGRVIYFEGDEAPDNVDPLLAQSPSEITVMRHLYEPLVTVDENAAVQPAAAASYTLSDDGLRYTFFLRENAVWSDEQPVTASDFVFNLQRALAPATKAACAGQLTAIVGAQAVLAGGQSTDRLGITAVNASTLEIRLTKADSNLLTVLSGAAGMPCRQDFFESCGGRYGMGKDYVISNGGFQVSRWSTDSENPYIRLAKREAYAQADAVKPSAVTMTFQKDADRLSRITKGDVDCAQLSVEELAAAGDAGLQTLSYYSDCYGLLFNTDQQAVTANPQLRSALIGAIDTQSLQTYLPGWCEKAHSLLVPGQYYGSQLYPSPDGVADPSDNGATADFDRAVEAVGADALQQLTLYYVEAEGIRPALDYLVQCWQKQFGLYVTLTPVSKSALASAVKDRSFDMAVCPMGNAGHNSLEVLEQFGSDADALFGGFAGKSLDTLLEKAGQAGESDLAFQQECEDYLYTKCIVMPLYYTKAYYVYSPSLTGLTLNRFTGMPDFTAVEKND